MKKNLLRSQLSLVLAASTILSSSALVLADEVEFDEEIPSEA